MTVLYVGSISFQMQNEDLEKEFGTFGKVTSARVVTDRSSGRSRGFGFVTFENKEDAEKAVKEMNEKEVMGRRIKVDFSQEKPDRRYGRDRRDRRYRSRSRSRGHSHSRHHDYHSHSHHHHHHHDSYSRHHSEDDHHERDSKSNEKHDDNAAEKPIEKEPENVQD